MPATLCCCARDVLLMSSERFREDIGAGVEGSHEVLVIGAGAAGLAAATMLKRQRVQTLLLERAATVGSSWRCRYNGLQLNTIRWLSNLPGLRMPKEYGEFPSREDYVAYLESYAVLHRLPIRFSVDVTRIEEGDGGWTAQTSAGELKAPWIVIATGPDQ